jgi:hypothetical protein
LRGEHILRVFENGVLRRMFGPNRDKVQVNGENFIMRSLMVCTPIHYCEGDKIEKNEMGGACRAYRGGKRRVQGFGGET